MKIVFGSSITLLVTLMCQRQIRSFRENYSSAGMEFQKNKSIQKTICFIHHTIPTLWEKVRKIIDLYGSKNV